LAFLLGVAAVLPASPVFAQSQPGQPRAAQARPPARATPAPSVPQATGPRTLQEALAAAYSNNPGLQAARAKLRATDESVPQALAGWRPTVVLSGNAGYADGITRNRSSGVWRKAEATRDIAVGQATLTQPLYRGGRTRASTNQAENKVMAERARLIAAEQLVFTDAVNAYVSVIQNSQILALNANNEQVLRRQLQATNDRFRVGEITRTDVAQAEAALAGATALRQNAEGNLAVARATYARVVGAEPGDLVPPQPLRLPVKSVQEAAALAAVNNPNVVAALFDDASAKDSVDVAFSALMPQLNLSASGLTSNNSLQPHNSANGGQVLATLSVPLYQGGAEHAAVRQARQTQQQTRKQVDEARRTAIQLATQAWATLDSARASVESTRTAIRANRIALEGVTREALVGSRTTLDVLNAQQAVLNSEVTLVQNLASLLVASHSVASAVGRLTARDLNLSVPFYDETAYYNAVRDRWAGTGDYETGQPGR
jgi:outer membrane protein